MYIRPDMICRALAIATALVTLSSVVVGSSPADSQAGTAKKPMRVALLVDTGAGTSAVLHQVRSSLVAFVDALPPDPELLLVSTGRRIEVRVQPTTDRKKVKDSINGLLADGGPTPLMDALREIDDRFMRKAEDRSPVFVILTGDGSENSVNTDIPAFNTWLRTLGPRGVSAHAVVLKTGNGPPEAVARAVTQSTGGHLETTGSGARLAGLMKTLAEQIGNVRPQRRGRRRFVAG